MSVGRFDPHYTLPDEFHPSAIEKAFSKTERELLVHLWGQWGDSGQVFWDGVTMGIVCVRGFETEVIDELYWLAKVSGGVMDEV